MVDEIRSSVRKGIGSRAPAALRFFFNKTLKRHLLDVMQMSKRHRKLPEILSPDEVALLIGSASNLLHQTMVECVHIALNPPHFWRNALYPTLHLC